MTKLVTLAAYENAMEAEIQRGRLLAEGIPAFVLDVNQLMEAGIGTPATPVVLQVAERDAEAALEILRPSRRDVDRPSRPE